MTRPITTEQPDRPAATIYEALINGSEIDTYDPVVGVTVHTDAYSYDFFPENGLTQIVIRPRNAIADRRAASLDEQAGGYEAEGVVDQAALQPLVGKGEP